MNLEPYYAGNDVALAFTVKDRLKPFPPYGASVSVFRGKEEIISNQSCTINDAVVSFTVDGDYTKQRGDYKAVFEVSLTPMLTRTHIRWFRILPKGEVISKVMDARFGKGLSSNSTAQQADAVFGQTLRELRRQGEQLVKAAKSAADLVAKKTGRRTVLDHYSEEGY